MHSAGSLLRSRHSVGNGRGTVAISRKKRKGAEKPNAFNRKPDLKLPFSWKRKRQRRKEGEISEREQQSRMHSADSLLTPRPEPPFNPQGEATQSQQENEQAERDRYKEKEEKCGGVYRRLHSVQSLLRGRDSVARDSVM
jgi:hypothetical protein